jgi:Tol biopolymer transport system component
MLAGGLVTAVAATAIVVSLSFANDSVAAEPGAGTVRASVGTQENQSSSDSSEPSISADGRYVAFTTDEPFDPVDRLDASPDPEDPDERRPDTDVYVRDTVDDTTTLISHGLETDVEGGPDRVVPSDGNSDQPSISADGRLVAFHTSAPSITKREFFADTVVVCDRDPDGDGRLNNSCAFRTISGDDFASNPHLSGDGQRVSYDVPEAVIVSLAPPASSANAGWIAVVNLRAGDEPPADDDKTYVTAPERQDIDDTEHLLDLQSDSTMSADGRHVAFIARYSHSDSPDAWRVYDYNVDTARLTELDVDAAGRSIATGGREFSHPTLSADGRRYAFADRQATNRIGVRLYDRGPDLTGNPTVQIASRKPDGTEGLGAQPALSADGRYLAFTTPTAGMHDGTDESVLRTSCLGVGASTYCDIVVRDIIVDQARAAADLPRLAAVLASPSVRCANQTQPCEGTGDSGRPQPTTGGSRLITDDGSAVLSADGSVVAYGSAATDLVAGDTNGHLDIFRHRFRPALAADPQDFGAVPLGAQSVRDIPLTHVGSGPLQVTAVAVDGADYDVFPGESCTTVVLHATEKCVVSVRFAPTVLGARAATLRVTVRDLEAPVVVPLTGTGVTPPTGVFAGTPGKLDFGIRPVLRTSPTKSVTVTNTGDAPLAIGAVTLGTATATTFPGDYRKIADACANRAIAPGASCRIDVRHRPTAIGARPAVLTVTYAQTLTFPVTLTGAGAAPTLVSSPTVTPAGRVIQVRGTNFPPGCTAKLSLVGMPGTTTAKAKPDGTFSQPFVVLPNTWTGKHPLNADVLPATAPGLSAPLRATLEFVIVPGSPVPPDFEFRR